MQEEIINWITDQLPPAETAVMVTHINGEVSTEAYFDPQRIGTSINGHPASGWYWCDSEGNDTDFYFPEHTAQAWAEYPKGYKITDDPAAEIPILRAMYLEAHQTIVAARANQAPTATVQPV
jgi:hypothetical protein